MIPGWEEHNASGGGRTAKRALELLRAGELLDRDAARVGTTVGYTRIVVMLSSNDWKNLRSDNKTCLGAAKEVADILLSLVAELRPLLRRHGRKVKGLVNVVLPPPRRDDGDCNLDYTRYLSNLHQVLIQNPVLARHYCGFVAGLQDQFFNPRPGVLIKRNVHMTPYGYDIFSTFIRRLLTSRNSSF